jgi:hypothetical protein
MPRIGSHCSAAGGPANAVREAVSLGLALMFGTAGLPHILMRFFTVPNAKEARKSVLWATVWRLPSATAWDRLDVWARDFAGPDGALPPIGAKVGP